MTRQVASLCSVAGSIVLMMSLTGPAVSSAQGTRITATTPARGGNPEAAKIANPVASSPASVAAGRRTFQLLCARCHGPEGKGDGGGAGAGGQPADLTDATWDFGGSDGEIFTVLRDGTSADMESYAERLNETELWNLVNFLRSLGPSARAVAWTTTVAGYPAVGRDPVLQCPLELAPTPGDVNDHIAVSYPDVRAALARLRAQGGRTASPSSWWNSRHGEAVE